MPKVAPKKGRKFQSSAAPGVFLRGAKFWLRYTFENEKVRVPLDTSDPAEANKKADELRGKPPKGHSGGAWKSQLKKYLKAKREMGKHRKSTGEKAEFAAQNFFAWTGCGSTEEVTKDILMGYYDAHRSIGLKDAKAKPKKAKVKGPEPTYRNTATARGYITSVAAFLRWAGNSITVSFPREEVPTKTLVIPRPRALELIASTSRLDLRFVLFSGFWAGMRKEEIVMSRPAWFDLENNYVEIPAIEEKSGRFFETKSGRSRKVPLEPEFKKFLTEDFGDWKGLAYMLHPDAHGERYRWDPRQPMETLFESVKLRKPRYKNLSRFKQSIVRDRDAETKLDPQKDKRRIKFLKSRVLATEAKLAEFQATLKAADEAWKGKEEMSMHNMRHSFGSHHIRRGVPPMRVALWLGDRLKTVESNYAHEYVDVGETETVASKAYDSLKEEFDKLRLAVETGSLSKAKIIAEAWTESLSKTEQWQQDIIDEALEASGPAGMDYDTAAGIIDEHDDSLPAKV